MKKWVGGLIIGLAVILACVYILIPATIKLKNNTSITATAAGLQRMLLDKGNILHWWPGKIIDDKLYYNDRVYSLFNNNTTVLPVSISGKGMDITSSLFFISVNVDSIHVEWVAPISTSYNPIRRISTYLDSKEINKDLDEILSRMKAFYSKPENIYGYQIERSFVVDSMLLSTSALSNHYPTTEFVYPLIDKLKKYAADHEAKESGYPMMNFFTLDSTNFEVKVALPVNKLLPSSGDILQKKMLGRGYILFIEVTGGMHETSTAMKQLQAYVEDHALKSPAIPFYSLVTDRTSITDSSKWITKVYYPVM